MITVYEIDPLTDSRWPEFLTRHKLASVFHSREWLEALRRTYGYRAVAITMAAPGEELHSALVFCRVKSWLTGNRVVSVPFSDHCRPLVDSEEQLARLLPWLRQEYSAGRSRYIEIRGIEQGSTDSGFSESARFHLHTLDLRADRDQLLHRLHSSCIRRQLARALRASFVYEEGRSDALLAKFYQLAVLTRRRQNLPPQPLIWFRNLIDCLGEKLKIRLLSHSGRPVAGILTLRFGRTLTYKYGFSDKAFHRFGSMQLLLWKAIEEGRREELVEFDMGRSEWGNEGLAGFKDRWGCTRSAIVYSRYPAHRIQREREHLALQAAKRLFALAPDNLLTAAGNVLYRHMA